MSADEPETFSGQLCRLAEETGLPTVLLTRGRDVEGIADLNALPDQMMVPAFPQEATQPGSVVAIYEVLLTKLKVASNDLLCFTNEDPHLLNRLGLRTCRLDDAVERLGTYSLSFRRGVLAGSIPMTSEVAHTTLVPLDLAIDTMSDPHAIFESGYRVFDMVLMVEGFVPLEGFAPKSLHKLVSRFAPILYALSDESEHPTQSHSEALETLWHAGCQRIIFASQTGQLRECKGMGFVKLAKRIGFSIEVLSWRHLINAGGSVSYV
ncbi:MAG: hypothetical protein ABJG15_13325 [Hyphomonadaceae bacterium]